MNQPPTPSTSALEHLVPPPPRHDVPSGKTNPPRRRWLWVTALVLLAVAGYFLWQKNKAAKSGTRSTVAGKKGGKGFAAIPVVATRVRKGDIGVYFSGLGAVTPIYTVSVKSRVDGQLMRILYKEGDMVKQGDLLVEIDPRPFQVQLEQAEGQLAKDDATLANARVDLTRYETLLTQNAVPEQQVATQRATVKQDEATIKSDQAQIDSAKLNLVY